MKARNQPVDLLNVAAAVGDGAAVDWTEVESHSTPTERDLAGHLRLLERIAAVHAGLPPVSAFEHSLRDSLLDQTAGVDGTATPAPTRWGPLTIVEKIGRGTYADVYRAVDPRLDRPVALKLLRHRDAVDAVIESEAIEEARLLARIRHPNVVTVYGAERIDGRAGIWMELVDGQTLEQELRERGPLAIDELISVGTVLCRALQAVHKAGLLHRDVKAQNVMRDRDGRVLLTDFGTGREVNQLGTAGELAGTPRYLAPEVLNGGAASVASDIYSLGVLLYHLATGSFPVSGRSLRDLSDAHARGAHRSLREARPDLSPKLCAAIDCATAVDVAHRHSSAQELEAALNRAATAQRLSRRALLGVVAMVATVVSASLWYFVLYRPTRPQVATTGAGLEYVTSTGDASLGVISPSGRFVAYVRTQATGQTLWLRSIVDGRLRQLTEPDPDRFFWSLSIDPHDAFVDFLAATGTPSSDDIWRVPLSSPSKAIKIAANVASGIGWSPDGRRMAFLRMTAGSTPHAELTIADADGNHETGFATPASVAFLPMREINRGVNRPVWSPDGTTIAILELTGNAVAVVDSSTGALRRNVTIGTEDTSLSGLAWLDDATLLLNRHDVLLAPFEVWRLDIRTGDAIRVTTDVSDYTDVSATSDGRMAASTRTDWRVGVWVGGPAGESMTPVLQEFTAGAIKWLSLDDRGDLALSLQISNERSLRVARLPGGLFEQIATRGQYPTLAPDGHALVFVDDDKTHGGLYRVGIDGSQPTLLARGQVRWPTITRDSRTVYFVVSNESGGKAIWTVPIDEGLPHEVVHRINDRNILVSPDGHELIIASEDASSRPVRPVRPVRLVCDLPACSSPRELHQPLLAKTSGAPWQMAPDGMGIGIVTRDAPTNIWLQPLDGRPPRQLTDFTDRKVTSFGWSPDGKRLAVARALGLSDIVLFRGPR